MTTSQRKFNFVSIPRCASQTIHGAFRTDKFMNHKSITKFPDRGLFSFAVIRDPVEHIRSWFTFHRSKKKIQSWYKGTFYRWCKDGFITHWTESECETMGLTHALSQWDYVTEDDKISVDHFLRFHRLEEDVEYMCGMLGLSNPKLRRTSPSGSIPIDPRIPDLIEKRFPKNFELYRMVK